MAVYTDISDPRYIEQLSQIEEAYGLFISSIEGIVLGSSNSLFKIVVQDSDAPLVLTIYEPPEVTPAGLTNEGYQVMLRYLEYLTSALNDVVDIYGAPVRLQVPKPLEAWASSQNRAPFVELSFDDVKKTASIVPYVHGKSYENTPVELPDPSEAFLVGRALAGYLKVAQSYPEPGRFPSFDFTIYPGEISRINDSRLAQERLGYVLSERVQEGLSAEKLGRDYLTEMKSAGVHLLSDWQQATTQEPAFPSTLIHNDLFADNVIIDDADLIYLLDFSETSFGPIGIDIGVALSSWASQNGVISPDNLVSFLEGFDSVLELTAKQLAQVPIYSMFGAYRWETFRVQRLELQDPRQRAMRSPAEFQSFRRGWRALQEIFDESQSVDDLAARLDPSHAGKDL
jgi:Ser/Thr protein kinase RdoA (MazF antagonist)